MRKLPVTSKSNDDAKRAFPETVGNLCPVTKMPAWDYLRAHGHTRVALAGVLGSLGVWASRQTVLGSICGLITGTI